MLSFLTIVFLFALVALPISLFKPDLFSKFYNSTRKKNALIFGGLLVAPFILIGLITPTPQSSKNADKITPTLTIEPAKTEELNSVSSAPVTLTKAPTPTPLPTSTNTPIPTKKVIYYSPTPIPATATSAPINIPTVEQQTQGGFACNCSKTCTQISSCAEAQYQLTACGCGARDGDNDGIACDSAPLHCQN